MTTQQDFLRAAMVELNMTRDMFCVRLGCARRTLDKWLLPATSKDFRSMEETIWDKHMNAEIEGREFPPEFEARLAAFQEQAFPKVRKYADSGAFLFSDRANAALKSFIEDEDAQSYFEHLDVNLAKAKACLHELIACSKTDLKL